MATVRSHARGAREGHVGELACAETPAPCEECQSNAIVRSHARGAREGLLRELTRVESPAPMTRCRWDIDASCERRGAYESARYGHRASRIGEASHPGPHIFVGAVRLALSLLAMLIHCHGAQQSGVDERPSPSHRSPEARRAARVEAKERQMRRAEFELLSSWASSRIMLSRGTCKLLKCPRVLARSNTQALVTYTPRHGRHEAARYGLRARRVGEASNPGPEFQRRRELLGELHRSEYIRGVSDTRGAARSSAVTSAAIRPEGAAKEAARMLVSLARRATPSGPTTGDIPECIRRQRWSSLNVPLIWAAAAAENGDDQVIIEWLRHVTADAPEIAPPAGDAMAIADALQTGWTALRARFRAWGINTCEDFVAWAHRYGYSSVRSHEHVHASCQEFVLNKAVEEDVHVANMEISYVAVAVYLSATPHLTRDLEELLSRRVQRSQQPPQPSGASSRSASGATLAAATSATRTGEASSHSPPASAWTAMAELDLEEILRQPTRTVREVPRWFRASVRQAFGVALRAREHRREAAWKLLILTPRMLLRPTEVGGEAGKKIFFERLRRYQQGDWAALLEESVQSRSRTKSRPVDEEAARAALREDAEKKVRLRELSKSRALLTSSGLAPRNDDTLAQLTDRELRPRELSAPLPAAAVSHRPVQKLELDRQKLLEALRRAGRGSAQDLAGMRYEHVRVLVEDDDLWALFGDLIQEFARAEAPEPVMQALRLGRMTALQKKDNKIRGIVAGSVIRRLTCKAVAAQFSEDFMARTAPFQFALQTKAGTDALAHAIRFLTDHDEEAVVCSLDGIGAFDHVRRAAFFDKLYECEELRPLLPLVSTLYGSTSRFLWDHENGEQVIIEQGEGGEQGCPLMPALFALAQHDALAAASGEMMPDEYIFAFLDDLYIVTSRARAGEAVQDVAWKVERHAGVRTHTGKLRAWSKGGGPAPPDLEDIGDEVWTADLPEEENGVVILGTPLGKPAFVQEQAVKRMEIENKMLEELPKFASSQAAWALLLQSAVPRANHTIRVVPPSQSAAYADLHDAAVWRAFCGIMGAEELEGDAKARRIAGLPGSLGGLGLRSARRIAEAAHWASWIDALPVLAAKAPRLAALIVTDLERASGPTTECLQEVAHARARLVELGAEHVPTWQEAVSGCEPPQPQINTGTDLELSRGWQWYASSVRESFFAERILRPICDPPQRATLISQAASGGAWLRAIPSEKALEFLPLRFHVAMRRRLRWPLPLASHRCRGRTCMQALDELGDHAASCTRSGLLKLRSRPIEQMWVRILREARARVRENVSLHEAGVPVDPADGRNIEIVATGLPIHQGIPVAIDATMVSPLHTDGTPHPHADERPGVALGRGRRCKEATYPELMSSSRLRLLTAGVETGGRLSQEALDLLEQLAAHRASSEPQALRGSIARAWRTRWTIMLSVTCQDSLAATLVDDGVNFLDAVSTGSPSSIEVWLEDM